jgi:hypothetical protein
MNFSAVVSCAVNEEQINVVDGIFVVLVEMVSMVDVDCVDGVVTDTFGISVDICVIVSFVLDILFDGTFVIGGIDSIAGTAAATDAGSGAGASCSGIG